MNFLKIKQIYSIIILLVILFSFLVFPFLLLLTDPSGIFEGKNSLPKLEELLIFLISIISKSKDFAHRGQNLIILNSHRFKSLFIISNFESVVQTWTWRSSDSSNSLNSVTEQLTKKSVNKYKKHDLATLLVKEHKGSDRLDMVV